MTKKKDSVTPKDSFYEECKPSLDKLFEKFNRSEKDRQQILSRMDCSIESEVLPEVKTVLVKLRAALISSEVAK